MPHRFLAAFILVSAMAHAGPGAAARAAPRTPVEHHVLDVTFDLATGRVDVLDRITLPQAPANDTFFGTLHGGLALAGTAKDASRTQEAIARDAAPPLSDVVIKGTAGQKTFDLRYGGVVHTPPAVAAAEAQRGFSTSPAVIEPRGVYLSGTAYWFVRRGGARVTYDVTLRGLPADFVALVPGEQKESAPGTWRFVRIDPADDIHVVAGPWTVSERVVEAAGQRVTVRALLRTPDAALAETYLSTTQRYLKMYADLIGPYPYKRFSLVENFWETGYGMPEFTLLGPRIIRFPFILHSSYPHELLHNWWGNGVFTPVRGDNWAEGLTAYLADHLVAEQRGQGAAHRRGLLVRFRDHVRPSNDFAVRSFSGRDTPASEAIGYGKWAMVLHMLRRRVGDEAFTAGLRRFYHQHRFERASFRDLIAAFQAASPLATDAFFRGFIDVTGAPRIVWDDVQTLRRPDGTLSLTLTLRQAQPGPTFPLEVPVLAVLDNDLTVPFNVTLTGRTGSATIDIPAPPIRIDIDPHFDTFRDVSPREVAPSISRALGDKKLLCVVPSAAAPATQKAWRALCEKWGGGHDMKVVTDRTFARMDPSRSVIVLGYTNLLRGAAQVGAKQVGVRFDDLMIELDEELRDNRKQSVALAVTHPTSPDRALLFVGAHHPGAIPLLAGKLPHYGKYGYTAFEGLKVENTAKGQWTANASPLTVRPQGPTTRRPDVEPDEPLATLASPFDTARMLKRVSILASPTYAGRDGLTPALQTYLTREMKRAGLTPAGTDGFKTCYAAGRDQTCNLIGDLPGSDPTLPVVVLGAHYDLLGQKDGQLFPGANDNASGVSVALESAQFLASSNAPRARTLRVVFFGGEEQGLLGSRAFVEALNPKANEAVAAMVNLDVVGRHSAVDGFAIFGTESATEWPHIFRGITYVTGHKTRLMPPQVAASDHAPFSGAGIPAVHIFSGTYPGYHRANDTPDTVRPESLEAVTAITDETLRYLLSRPTPLTATDGRTRNTSAILRPRAPGRAVRLGVVPDFAFTGRGVRVYDVGHNTPAAQAGLKKNDVIHRFDGRPLRSLRQMSMMLRRKKPGDTVALIIVRDGQDVALTATLVASDAP